MNRTVSERMSFINAIFTTKNDFTEYVHKGGGAELNALFVRFKESKSYEDLMKFLECVEYIAVKELREVADPEDSFRISILQQYAELPNIFKAFVENMAVESLTQKSNRLKEPSKKKPVLL